MEIAIFWFLSMVALGTEIENKQAEIDQMSEELVLHDKWIRDNENWSADLEQSIETLEEGFISLSAKHSAANARDRLQYDTLKKKTDFLEDKIELLHP